MHTYMHIFPPFCFAILYAVFVFYSSLLLSLSVSRLSNQAMGGSICFSFLTSYKQDYAFSSKLT
jgi:hypothetical protein